MHNYLNIQKYNFAKHNYEIVILNLIDLYLTTFNAI